MSVAWGAIGEVGMVARDEHVSRHLTSIGITPLPPGPGLTLMGELLAERHEHDGVTVVAINYQEPLPAIRRFLDAQPVTLPILLDRDGAMTNAWTPKVFPSTVLIDRKGQPRADREHQPIRVRPGQQNGGEADQRRRCKRQDLPRLHG